MIRTREAAAYANERRHVVVRAAEWTVALAVSFLADSPGVNSGTSAAGAASEDIVGRPRRRAQPA
jgi:hypothetical protein